MCGFVGSFCVPMRYDLDSLLGYTESARQVRTRNLTYLGLYDSSTSYLFGSMRGVSAKF